MYPISVDIDYIESRSRLTNFFRGLLAIPAEIVTYLYGIVASVAGLIAWVVLIFTAKYPEGLYNFIGGYLRNNARVSAYVFNIVDAYPPFSGEPDDAYPLRVGIGQRQESYSRLKVFFRGLLVIPAMIVVFLFAIVAFFAWIVAFFVILFTGKLPQGLHNAMAKVVILNTKVNAYYFCMTDVYPPFSVEPSQPAAPAAA